MTLEALLAAMHEEAVRALAAGQKYTGTFDLYRSAVTEGDAQLAEDLRLKLHVLLDIMLDSLATQRMLHIRILAYRG
jgi:hypothetical protein